MDPNATLERLLKALRDRDGDEACAAAEDLIEWLDRGGAAPRSLHLCVGKAQQHRGGTETDKAFRGLMRTLSSKSTKKACGYAEGLVELIDQGQPLPRALEPCLRINGSAGDVMGSFARRHGYVPRDNPSGFDPEPVRVRRSRADRGNLLVKHKGEEYELQAGLGREPFDVFRDGSVYWVVVREPALPFVAVDVFDLDHHRRTSRDPEGEPVEADPESSMAAQEHEVESRFGSGWEKLKSRELIERAMR